MTLTPSTIATGPHQRKTFDKTYMDGDGFYDRFFLSRFISSCLQSFRLRAPINVSSILRGSTQRRRLNNMFLQSQNIRDTDGSVDLMDLANCIEESTENIGSGVSVTPGDLYHICTIFRY
ncbi:hypothetical protein K435DRAFT_851260 [Dendrothele bispora CBS 962.96]|uniref:Uncharacterized protein n=1 Tax=Dendrothele bispora (strain CBS 962.96) TaxID=1314807 RepID=A0A4S8LNC5_DENBC|nr:hypothetical protein K435DRAFT_864481 [Dendrothele bispora CBS 962.96]THV04076.1 hypothetical protein K435DRAFT_851260 [Dendrothele bispora CBS 962.96]